MQNIGQSAVHFQKLHSKIKILPTNIKLFILKILSNSIIIFFSRIFGKYSYYYCKSWQQFLIGMDKK